MFPESQCFRHRRRGVLSMGDGYFNQLANASSAVLYTIATVCAAQSGMSGMTDMAVRGGLRSSSFSSSPLTSHPSSL